MSLDISEEVGGPVSSDESLANADPVWTQEAIEAERQRIAGDRWAKRVLGRGPTPETLADIEGHIRRMDGENLALALSILGQLGNDDTAAVTALQELLGHERPGGAYQLRQLIDALRFGVLPTSPAPARRAQRRIRTFRTRFEESLAPDSLAYLGDNEQRLGDMLADEAAQEAEDDEAAQAEAEHSEHLAKAGVYVFTYPHYHRHPTIPSERTDRLPDRTLMKIGSASNLGQRIDQIANQTAAPEPRRILRLYLSSDPDADVRELEYKFHRLLDAAGHAGPRRASVQRQTGGTEWFTTSLDFLDSVAATLALEIIVFDAVEGL